MKVMSASYPDPVGELERRLLTDWLPSFCRKYGFDPNGYTHAHGTFREAEAVSMLRGLDVGVVSFGEGAQLGWPGPVPLPLFWEGWKTIEPRPIWLAHEVIVVAAAAADLHLDYGWPKEQMQVEVSEEAFDLGVFDDLSGERLVIAAEAKSSEHLLTKLVNQVRACGQIGEHPERVHTLGTHINGHRKYAGLVRENPPYFWAIAPECRWVFKVETTRQHVSLIRTDDVPSGPR
jgi:hypothetical protein